MWSPSGRLPVSAALAVRQAGRGCGQDPNLRGPRTCWSIFRVREALVLVTLTSQAGEGRDWVKTGDSIPCPPLFVCHNHRAFAVQWWDPSFATY